MSDPVCRVPSNYIPASFQPTIDSSLLVCQALPQIKTSTFSATERITNISQAPLNHSVVARNSARGSNQSLSEFSQFWSFNWWQEASGGERALGLGVATLAAVPTVAALTVAAGSSVLGMGCGGNSDGTDGGSVIQLPDAGNTDVSVPRDAGNIDTSSVPQNRSPYFISSNYSVDVRAGENIQFNFDAVDLDGDPITYSLDRVQYTATGTDGAPRTVLHALTAYASYFDRSSGVLSVPTNSMVDATYVFTVSAQDNRGLSASTHLRANVMRPTMPTPPQDAGVITPAIPPDSDGDGFRADIDCDDTNANVRPLGSDFDVSINSNITICAGNYSQLTISGNGIRVNTQGGAVNLSHLRILGLINSTVDGINVSGRGERRSAFDPFPCLIYISGVGNTFSNLTAECELTSTSCSGMIIQSSNNNIIRNSAFRNGYTGLWIFSGSDNSVLNNSFIGQSLSEGRPLYHIDRGSRNNFSANIYR